ncbi:isochorismatase family protein [Propylenella binzhouense]|uniref:Isochorismatase family protein n=1 Tax=Propylenella binzhouense TaxID=2555902 RepID=A0A964T799_9HYPH|nr:isochorismatase family protein [Propylenella binzhouense]MYZ49139.1 isochorismatase family protein [Propylenella binzhouense]
MARIWDSFLTERDKAVIAAAGYGARNGFGQRPALLVIDVTYGFTGDRPEPILESIRRFSNSSGAESWDAIGVIGRLAEACRAKRIPVIYSAGEVRPDNWDACSWSWKNRRSEEAVAPAPQAFGHNDIVAEIAPAEQDIVIRKQKPSAFFGTQLASYLVYLGCDSVIVTGTTTSGCVRATVVDAFSFNFRSIVVEDGCFDRSQASHAVSLFDLDAKYADVLGSQEVLDYVGTLSDSLFPNLPSAR